MAARTIWKGSISFGLVNIPVQVFVATQKDEFSPFNQLDEKGHKIKYKKWCPIEEREVPWSEIKKGYEITKNKKKNTSPSNSKAYSLFVKILNETNKVAIGKVVLRDKEHLVALRSYQRGLIMHQLKYLDEIKPMDEVEGISSSQHPKIEDKELSLGKTLVDNLTSEQFDIGKYSDTYSKELEKLIDAKSKGQNVTISEEEEKAEDTTNLLEALKASISIKSKFRRQKRN